MRAPAPTQTSVGVVTTGATTPPQQQSRKQKLGLDVPTKKPPLAPYYVSICCCFLGCHPCAHYITRPGDLCTKSFLGVVAYLVGWGVLNNFYLWLFWDSDPSVCWSKEPYPIGCELLGYLIMPLELYMLYVIFLSYRQHPTQPVATQQPVQMQQIQTPAQPSPNPGSVPQQMVYQQQPTQYQQQQQQQPTSIYDQQQQPTSIYDQQQQSTSIYDQQQPASIYQ